jgi:flagellar brake protein
MDTQSDFLISSPEKIIAKLSVLLKNKNLLTAKCSERGSNFVTKILDIDKKNKVFICDGCEEEQVEQFLRSPKIMFKTEHLGALVTFDASKISRIQFQGNLAFTIPLPATLRWREQREFYRVRIPATATTSCQIQLADTGPASFKLYDISIQGFSMLNTEEALSDFLTTGARFENCKLMLDSKEEISISFEIRSKFLMNPNNLNKSEKIGCKFTVLTPAFENTIHGYMLGLEREILKKRAENISLTTL